MTGRLIDKYGTIADYLVENPLLTRQDIADLTGLSYSTVCLIVRSDAFSSILHERKSIIQALVAEKVESRIEAVAIQGLEQLSAAMEGCADKEFLLRASATLLDRTTAGRPQQESSSQPVVQITINEDVWKQSQARMIPQAPPQTLEVLADEGGRAVGEPKALDLFEAAGDD